MGSLGHGTLSDGSVMLEIGLAAERLSSSLAVSGRVAGLGIPLNISVAFTASKLDLRLCVTFLSRAPYVDTLKFSLAAGAVYCLLSTVYSHVYILNLSLKNGFTEVNTCF